MTLALGTPAKALISASVDTPNRRLPIVPSVEMTLASDDADVVGVGTVIGGEVVDEVVDATVEEVGPGGFA